MKLIKAITQPTAVILTLVVVAFILRTFQLQSVPGILNRDEAALAYNALLLKQTGQDEWGRQWPLALESFGDYKLPGYVWLLTGLFTFLPYQDWVVRLPAAIAGTSLIPLVYVLAKRFRLTQNEALIAAIFTFSAPVFLFYSRMAFEAVVALALFVLALDILLRQPQSETKNMFPMFPKSIQTVIIDTFAIAITSLAVFTYNTPLLLLPIVLFVVPINRGVKQWKSWIVPVLGLASLFVVSLYVLLPLTAQKSGITIFSDETTLITSIAFRQSLPSVFQPILGNKYVYFFGIATQSFINSFSPIFMVTEGGAHPWHSIPGFGHIGWGVYVLGILGILHLLGDFISSGFQKKNFHTLGLLFFFGASLLPSVVTVDSPHTTRSLMFFIFWILVATKGVSWLANNKISTFIVCSIVVLEFCFYSFNYFYIYPNQQPLEFKIGFKNAIQGAKAAYTNEPIAVVDDGGYLYISTAWYLQLSPEEYFKTIIRQQPDSIGFRYGEQVSNFHFIASEHDLSKTGEKILLNWKDNSWQLETH